MTTERRRFVVFILRGNMALFKKEILRNQRGLKSSAGEPLSFTREDLRGIAANFRSGKVWIPYTHSTDPRDNTGFVQKLWYDENSNSLWAEMEVDDQATERIKKRLVQDVSVSLKKDEKRGWILKHVALTLDPALTNQKGFMEAEAGDFQIELNDLEPFVNVNGATEENMADQDTTEKVEEQKDDKEERVDLEETKGLVAKVRELLDFAGKNKELEGNNKTLQAQLEERDKRITDLEDTVNESKEAISALLEDRRKSEWEAVFESYLGKRVVRAEKEMLAQRIADPAELKAELEARADIGLTENKTEEIKNDQKGDPLANLTDEQLALVKERGWDKDENKKYLHHYLDQLELEEQKG